ncbi:MAG: DUF4349 domain-containing protein [Halanaerobiaceae bacterium]
MKHENIRELLPLYIDNELSTEEKNLIKEHLKNCSQCQKELKKYQENSALLSSMKKIQAPSNFAETILNKVGENMKDQKNDNNTKKNTFLDKIRNFFSFPVKIPAGIIGLVVIIILITFTGIPNSLFNQNSQLESKPEIMRDSSGIQNESLFNLGDTAQQYGSQKTKSYKSTNPSANQDIMRSSEIASEPPNESSEISQIDRRIIKRANLSIEIKDIGGLNDKIANLTENYNGYISDSRNWVNQDDRKFFHYQLRIPAENFNIILTELSTDNFGQVVSRSISGQDVTEEYLDIEIRLKNLEAQEERYRQLLEKADDVEDILKIENELNRIRTEIERLQGRKKYLNDQVGYSTINVDFQQPEPISSGTPGIIKALRNAINKMVYQFYNIIMMIGTFIPYILLLLLLYLFYRIIRRRK